MKCCPNCGANVEGLLYQCDCCGAMLLQTNPVFVQYTNTVAEAGKVSSYMKVILDKLNLGCVDSYFPQFNTIAFEMYCYPEDMVHKFNIHDKNYVSLRRKKAILTRTIRCEEFLMLEECQKITMLSKLVMEGLLGLHAKVSSSGEEDLKAKINQIIQ